MAVEINPLLDLPYEQYIKLPAPVTADEIRWRCLNDRFFLMEHILGATLWINDVSDSKKRYLYNFVRNIENQPYNCIDLAPRFHVKSLASTYAGIIQYILTFPEKTTAIFSYKKALAKGFLTQIKREFEENYKLKRLFPDILYQNPKDESPKWSENEGIVIKRVGNPKEPTLGAFGIIDSQLTGVHFNRLHFDDAIEKEAAGSQYMMEKAEDGIRLILGGLGTHDRVISGVGTRWKINDAYENLSRDKLFSLRVTHGATPNSRDGVPIYLTQEEWDRTKIDFSPYQFSCLMCNDPVADSAKNFSHEWLRWYDKLGDGWRKMNRYILVDPANQKKKTSDYTAMVVIGINAAGDYYVLDIVHDRLNLPERLDKLFNLFLKWKPKGVGYERYGMSADIEAIKMREASDMINLNVIELGGKLAKEDRIEGIMPLFEQGKLYLPRKLMYIDWEGMNKDVVDYFVNWEYLAFPNGQHDDILDAMARIMEPALKARAPDADKGYTPYWDKGNSNEKRYREDEGSWLSA